MEEQKKNPAQGLSESEQVQVRRQKLADLQAAGHDPFTLTKYPQDAYSADLKAEFADLPNETDSGKTVALAGRMMSKRVMGKASFAHLRDDKGDIQLYVRRDELGEEPYAAFKKLDVGDIVGVSGHLFRTKTGLNVQAIGENPSAADAASIQVTKWKYINILLGGGICGIGGAYCSMVINGGVWISDCVGGLGWISVALVIFAAWRPQVAILGSFVFGALRILKYYMPAVIPIAFFNMLPFIITAIVLLAASIRGAKGSHIPENLGNNYFREER